MNKLLTVAGALLACTLAWAQNTVLDVKPAHDGKNLTMEEAIYKGVGYSRIPRMFLQADGTLADKPQEPAKERYTLFTDRGSLFVRDNEREESFVIAPSDGPNLVYGETVSRNEFGIDAGWYMSPDSSKVAFYRKDQNKVTWFPLLDIDTRTGELRQIKYPMNGMDSEEVAVGVYDFASGKTVYLEVNDFTTERYITNISWSPDSRSLYAQILDRSQHHAKLNQYSAATGNFVRTLLTEDNEAWVEPLNPIYFIKGRTDLFLYRTDNRDGFWNLYLVDTLGTLRRLPTASADIDYVDNDGTNVYYTSAENSPVQNHLYKMQLKLPGKNAVKKAKFYKPVQLTSGRGWHHVQLTPDCKWFLDAWSNTSTPYQVYRRSTDGKVNEKVHEADDPLKGYASCQVELGTVPSADGQFRNYYRLIYPKNFDPAKKYPVILYVYGGPHSQMVQDSWLGQIRMWEMLMAQKGYLVYCGCRPYWRSRLELRRFHDHQPHDHLPGHLQGGRRRRPRYRLEMVRDYVRGALHGYPADQPRGLRSHLPYQQGQGPQRQAPYLPGRPGRHRGLGAQPQLYPAVYRPGNSCRLLPLSHRQAQRFRAQPHPPDG